MTPARAALIKDCLHASAGRVCDAFLPELKKYVVLSAGRSGSNLLVSFIKSIPKNIQHGEIIGEFQLQSMAVRQRINKTGPAAYLDRRLSRMTTETLTGAKLLYRHLEDDYGEKFGIPGTGGLLDHLLSRDDIRIVHLSRRDKLAVLISTRLAYETGEWVGGSYGDRTVHLPVDWVRDRFAWLEGWEDRIAASFPAQRVLQMTYEELVSDTGGEMQRLFRFLDVPAAPVHSSMSKQNKRPKPEVIENYAELKEAFSGTPHAPLFDA
ncbi:sulfotransferase [Ruegeria jejuensis]|uniref:sulfotransferase n=1 Tax=Ruegeria jejuensis TaxID=3233338 RepID=UPI00355B5D32